MDPLSPFYTLGKGGGGTCLKEEILSDLKNSIVANGEDVYLLRI